MRSMSSRFYEMFTVYGGEFYWDRRHALSDRTQLSVNALVDDSLEAIRQLGLREYVLLGHSVYGGLVMEIAKRRDPELRGIVAMGASPGWNTQLIELAAREFEANASTEKKERFKLMQEAYQRTRQPNDSLASVDCYYSESAKYFGQSIERDMIVSLWGDLEADDELFNHFFGTVLPEYQFSTNIEHVEAPVFLAGGRQDYDSIPLVIWPNHPKPKDFTLVDCGEVGHWPQLEQADFFDTTLQDWLQSKSLF